MLFSTHLQYIYRKCGQAGIVAAVCICKMLDVWLDVVCSGDSNDCSQAVTDV